MNTELLLKKQAIAAATGHLNKTHGMSKTKTYKSWQKMKARCYDVRNNRYYCYGAKGIKVCERWLNSFENFLADMGEKPESMTLDRIDCTKDYSPENCRWADAKQQARNTSRNHWLDIFGQRKTIAEWADFSGVSQSAIRRRIVLGWSGEKLLTPIS